MQAPLKVKFEGSEPSDAARFQIEQEVERLQLASVALHLKTTRMPFISEHSRVTTC